MQPTAPTELWLRIFDFAISVPGALDTDTPNPFDLSAPFCRVNEMRALKSSVVAARNLVRVCRSWECLISPLLYRIIIIGRGRSLLQLRHTLMRSEMASSNSRRDHPLGWYTNRLDLRIRGGTHASKDLVDAELEALADILRHLPNLVIVSFKSSTKSYPPVMPYFVVHALARTCGHSLQVIHWPDTGTRTARILDPDAHDWKMLLAAAPGLRSVRCSDVYNALRQPFSPTASSICLKELTTLTFSNKSCGEYAAGLSSLPALRQVRYHDCTSCIPLEWKAFLRSHGAHITTVTIIAHNFASDLQGHMDILAEACPSLVQLVIDVKIWARFNAHIRLPDTTSILGVACRRPHATNSEYATLFHTLSTLRGSRLRHVRLMNPGNVTDLRVRHSMTMKQGLNVMAGSPLCLEDHDGRAII